MKSASQRGFTLIEMLIVIAIVGILSSVVLVSVNNAREKAKAAQTVAQMRELEKAVILYVADTGVRPASCLVSRSSPALPICNSSNSAFENALGVAGWNGPYIRAAELASGWGGHLGYLNEDQIVGSETLPFDLDQDGTDDHAIWIDDDAPGTGLGDNSGTLDVSMMTRIDEILDDGDLETGNLRRSDNHHWPGRWNSSGIGEMIYKLPND